MLAQQSNLPVQAPTHQELGLADGFTLSSALPPNFVGHDVEKVFAWAKNLASNFEKGEFETTPQYQARVANFDQIIAPLTTKSILAFTHEISGSYDADKSEFKYQASYEKSNRLAPKPVFIELRRTTSNAGEYIASNAYGATVRVERKTLKVLELEITSADAFKAFDLDFAGSFDFYPTSPARCYFTLKMSPDEARAVIKNISVIYIGSVKAPLLTKAEKFLAAEMRSPIALTLNYERLQFTPFSMGFFNNKTGAIIGFMGESKTISATCF